MMIKTPVYFHAVNGVLVDNEGTIIAEMSSRSNGEQIRDALNERAALMRKLADAENVVDAAYDQSGGLDGIFKEAEGYMKKYPDETPEFETLKAAAYYGPRP